MKVLYAENGFEQDMRPQLCLEGSCTEFEDLINKIKQSIQNNREGEIFRFSGYSNVNNEIILINKLRDNKIITRIATNKYLMSLDASFWNRILCLIEPLLNNKGYQFIEFDDIDSPLIEDIGLLFRSV
jgi:hypothetical protein